MGKLRARHPDLPPAANEFPMSNLRNLPTWALALIVPLVATIAVIVTLTTTSADSTTVAANAIAIKNFTFAPETVQAKVGVPVTVSNADNTAHTVTADDKSFDTGDLGGGAKATITIDTPGKYAYHCDIHNYMTGVIEAT